MAIEALVMLSQIVAGISLLALLWLTARAFKQHTLWGLSVLLLPPISAVAFGIKYWEREKLPFLAYIGTFAVLMGLMLSLFSAWGGWELLQASRNAQQALQTQTLTQADADAFQKASLSFSRRSGIDYQDKQLLVRIKRQFARQAESEDITARAKAREAQEAEAEEYTLESLYRRAPVKKERYRRVYKQIRVADARKYIGATVKVTRKNVEEKEYRLAGASANSLQFSQRNRSGSFSFSFKNRDIEKIRVLTKQPY